MFVTEFHGCVTGHVTAELFLVNCAVDVAEVSIFIHIPVVWVVVIGFTLQSNSCFQNIAGCDVQSDEFHIRIICCNFSDGAAEGITRHNDDIVSVIVSFFNHGNTFGGAVTGGFVVGEVDTIGIAPGFGRFISGLVEGLVSDITIVSDHSNAHFIRRGYSHDRQNHHDGQNNSKKFFHENFLL